MGTKSNGWIDILTSNDNEALWGKLFRVISRHSAVRMLYAPSGMIGDALRDIHADLTQELFLKLHQKDRWSSYLEQDYTDEEVEQELYRIEVPNLISQLQRERYPESYRIARRISDLLQTKADFRYYPHPTPGPNGVKRNGCNKMALKMYGLSFWPLEKQVKPASALQELIRDVAFRYRDTRRTGRGSGSQVIISNDELKRLIFDIFVAIDSLSDVRTMRSLVLSKLAVEDCRLVSIDAAATIADEEQPAPRLDVADGRPSPLDVLLEKETTQLVDRLVEELLEKMRRTVRNKPQRFRKLVQVAWECYFNPCSPSQSSIAAMMRISDSLVSHYRRIFDTLVLSMSPSIEELSLLNSALEKRLAVLANQYCSEQTDIERVLASRTTPVSLPYPDNAEPLAAHAAGMRT